MDIPYRFLCVLAKEPRPLFLRTTSTSSFQARLPRRLRAVSFHLCPRPSKLTQAGGGWIKDPENEIVEEMEQRYNFVSSSLELGNLAVEKKTQPKAFSNGRRMVAL